MAEKSVTPAAKQQAAPPTKSEPVQTGAQFDLLLALQKTAGNRAVSQLLKHENGSDSFIASNGHNHTGIAPSDAQQHNLIFSNMQDEPQLQNGFVHPPEENQQNEVAAKRQEREIQQPVPDCAQVDCLPAHNSQSHSQNLSSTSLTQQQAELRNMLGPGEPLPLDVREEFEQHFSEDFHPVRVHTNSRAADTAEVTGAYAYTLGSDIVFGAGQFVPHTRIGKQLLAHELTHTMQQHSATTQLGVQMNRKSGNKRIKKKKIKSVTLLVNVDTVVLELDDGTVRTLGTTYNGKPQIGSHKLKRSKEKKFIATPPVSTGQSNEKGYVVEWIQPEDVTYIGVESYTFHVIKYHPLPSRSGEQDKLGAGGEGKKAAEAGGGKGKEAKGEDGGTGKSPGSGTSKTGIGDVGKDKSKTETYSGPRLTPEQEVVWRQMAELMLGTKDPSKEDIAELVRLFHILQLYVEDPVFGEGGENWAKFARFLDKNRDKIEGMLKGSPEGRLNSEVIGKIIKEYKKFVAIKAEKEDTKGKGELKSLKDFDKEFEYDPGWANLSKKDRKLLLEYAKLTPEQASKKKIDFTHVTTEMKIVMALKRSDKSLLGEMAQAAVDAFTDATFIITFVVIMAVYVGLWLTPDPSLITKLAAGALTVVLLTQFAWDDIYGLAKAFAALWDNCEKATTTDELKASGDKFLITIGPIGFDIILFIVMWRVGKRVGPKIQKFGLERATARAEIKLGEAKAKPGSGEPLKAKPETAKLLEEAKSKAGNSAKPSEILDQLSKSLEKTTPEAKSNLDKFRSKVGDEQALRAIESQHAKRLDILHFLEEKGLTPEKAAAVKSEVVKAHSALVRLKLIQIEAIKDPNLRKQAKVALYSEVKAQLDRLGILKDPKVRSAIEKGHNLQDLVSEIGEAIARAELQTEYPATKGYRILSNIEIVEEVPGYRTIAEWKAAQSGEVKPRDIAGLYEADGKLWRSLGEIDTMAVEKTASGKVRPVEMEQVKTGGESAAEALAQNQKVIRGMEEVAAEAKNKAIYEKTGKNKLGKDITSMFDLSGVSKVLSTARGLPGKPGFHKFLYPKEVLEAVAKSLMKPGGLPSEEPAIPKPKTVPRKEEEKQVPVP